MEKNLRKEVPGVLIMSYKKNITFLDIMKKNLFEEEEEEEAAERQKSAEEYLARTGGNTPRAKKRQKKQDPSQGRWRRAFIKTFGEKGSARKIARKVSRKSLTGFVPGSKVSSTLHAAGVIGGGITRGLKNAARRIRRGKSEHVRTKSKEDKNA